MTVSTNYLRPLLLLVLVGALMSAIVQLAQAVAPNWHSGYLIIMCMLAALEGMYSLALLKAQNTHGGDLTKFHIIELIALVFLLKVVSSLGSLPDILTRFLTLDVQTIVGSLLIVLFWKMGLDTGRDFADLDEPIIPTQVDPNYVSPAVHLRQRFFSGGIVLLVVVGILNSQRIPLGGLVPTMLIYFVAGLLFVSQIRFATASREWRSLGLSSSEAVATPWFRSAAILVGIATLVAFVLPTAYTQGLLEFLRQIADVIISIVTYIFLLLTWLLTLPFRLLSGQPAGQPADLALPKPPPFAQQAATTGTDILGPLLIKLGLIAVVAYIIISYVRDNPEIVAMLKRFRVFRWLQQLWAILRRQANDFGSALRTQLPKSLPNWLRRNRPTPFKFVRLNSLSPRERIMYFYLSTLQRAHEQGIPRNPDQTPYEYEDVLKRELTESEIEVNALTQAFVEARYSPQPVDAETVKRTQAYWQQLRQVIQRAKRQKPDNETKR